MNLSQGILGGIFTLAATTAQAGYVQVENFSKKPAYKLTVDDDDKVQLTDGKIYPQPMWRYRGAVGWASTPRIGISLKFDSIAKALGSGVLRLHVGKGTLGQVYVPARIDAYSVNKTGQYVHIGEIQRPQSEFGDNQAHWVNIPLPIHEQQVFLVVQAGGPYVMMDEIEWVPDSSVIVSTVTSSSPLVNDAAAISDSVNRLSLATQKMAQDKQSQLIASMSPQISAANTSSSSKSGPAIASDISAWTIPPYTKDPVIYSMEHSDSLSKRYNIVGYNGEKESFILAVANKGAAKKRVFFNQVPSGSVYEFKIIDKVVAADGSQIYDPLVGFNNTSGVEIDPGKIVYVWVTVDLGGTFIGNKTFLINISDGTASLDSISASITVKRIKFATTLVSANAWAYPSDLPIWNVTDENVKDLRAHKVNVDVINDTPRLQKDGSVPVGSFDKMIRQMKMFRNEGVVLLYLGWPSRFSSEGINSLPESVVLQYIKTYVTKLDRAITDAGISHSEWALYPVDEPSDGTVDLLKKIAPLIKSVNKEIKIFANPVKNTKLDGGDADLLFLRPYVDLWQPHLEYARMKKGFFQSLGRKWWIYHHPKSHISKSQPPEYFRGLSWAAWDVGADGVGFWSYSRVSGTTAWIDTDGGAADWAVVYEGPAGPISSRRWEAFRDGVEDFELLRSASQSAVLSEGLKTKINASVESDFGGGVESIDQLRSLLLGQTK